VQQTTADGAHAAANNRQASEQLLLSLHIALHLLKLTRLSLKKQPAN